MFPTCRHGRQTGVVELAPTTLHQCHRHRQTSSLTDKALDETKTTAASNRKLLSRKSRPHMSPPTAPTDLCQQVRLGAVFTQDLGDGYSVLLRCQVHWRQSVLHSNTVQHNSPPPCLDTAHTHTRQHTLASLHPTPAPAPDEHHWVAWCWEIVVNTEQQWWLPAVLHASSATCQQCYLQAVLLNTSAIYMQSYLPAVLTTGSATCQKCYSTPLLPTRSATYQKCYSTPLLPTGSATCQKCYSTPLLPTGSATCQKCYPTPLLPTGSAICQKCYSTPLLPTGSATCQKCYSTAAIPIACKFQHR